MKIIDIDQMTIYCYDSGQICHVTVINIEPEWDLKISFNPTSSLYDEENFEGKHSAKPPALWNMWGKDKWYKHPGGWRRGIGEGKWIKNQRV